MFVVVIIGVCVCVCVFKVFVRTPHSLACVSWTGDGGTDARGWSGDADGDVDCVCVWGGGGASVQANHKPIFAFISAIAAAVASAVSVGNAALADRELDRLSKYLLWLAKVLTDFVEYD